MQELNLIVMKNRVNQNSVRGILSTFLQEKESRVNLICVRKKESGKKFLKAGHRRLEKRGPLLLTVNMLKNRSWNPLKM